MPRYFLEVAYKGTHYSGFQVQENANSVQSEIEKAFAVYFRRSVELTGSSRTDAGVHALQNFFHFDFDAAIPAKAIYHINAILPPDIVVKNVYEVEAGAHCRFDAQWREYHYFIYRKKDPFLRDRAYYFPYTLDLAKMQAAAALLADYTDFTSFSKRNTQAKTALCTVSKSAWFEEGGCYIYRVRANRFLRGMVRGLVGTMLQVGRDKIGLEGFRSVIESRDCTKADFSVPGSGLFLMQVHYPDGILSNPVH